MKVTYMAIRVSLEWQKQVIVQKILAKVTLNNHFASK